MNKLIETTWASNEDMFMCVHITHVDECGRLLTVEKDTADGEITTTMSIDELYENYYDISGDDVQW